MNLLPATLLLIALFSLIIPPASPAAEPISLTSPAGKSIRAILIAVDQVAQTVKYKRVKDGSVFTSNLSIFDAKTQQKLNAFSAGPRALEIEVDARHKLIFDQEANEWSESFAGKIATGSGDLYRSVFELENKTARDARNLKIDLVVVIGPKNGMGEIREERQTFSILRLKKQSDIQVQTRLYPVRVRDESGRAEETILGTAIRLRDTETGESVFSWKSKKIGDYALVWDIAETQKLAHAGSPVSS